MVLLDLAEEQLHTSRGLPEGLAGKASAHDFKSSWPADCAGKDSKDICKALILEDVTMSSAPLSSSSQSSPRPSGSGSMAGCSRMLPQLLELRLIQLLGAQQEGLRDKQDGARAGMGSHHPMNSKKAQLRANMSQHLTSAMHANSDFEAG